MGQTKCVGGEQCHHWNRITAAGENVDDDGSREDILSERFLTSCLDGWQTIRQNTGENTDHLFVAIINLFKPASDLLHG